MKTSSDFRKCQVFPPQKAGLFCKKGDLSYKPGWKFVTSFYTCSFYALWQSCCIYIYSLCCGPTASVWDRRRVLYPLQRWRNGDTMRLQQLLLQSQCSWKPDNTVRHRHLHYIILHDHASKAETTDCNVVYKGTWGAYYISWDRI